MATAARIIVRPALLNPSMHPRAVAILDILVLLIGQNAAVESPIVACRESGGDCFARHRFCCRTVSISGDHYSSSPTSVPCSGTVILTTSPMPADVGPNPAFET